MISPKFVRKFNNSIDDLTIEARYLLDEFSGFFLNTGSSVEFLRVYETLFPAVDLINEGGDIFAKFNSIQETYDSALEYSNSINSISDEDMRSLARQTNEHKSNYDRLVLYVHRINAFDKKYPNLTYMVRSFSESSKYSALSRIFNGAKSHSFEIVKAIMNEFSVSTYTEFKKKIDEEKIGYANCLNELENFQKTRDLKATHTKELSGIRDQLDNYDISSKSLIWLLNSFWDKQVPALFYALSKEHSSSVISKIFKVKLLAVLLNEMFMEMTSINDMHVAGGDVDYSRLDKIVSRFDAVLKTGVQVRSGNDFDYDSASRSYLAKLSSEKGISLSGYLSKQCPKIGFSKLVEHGELINDEREVQDPPSFKPEFQLSDQGYKLQG